MALKPKTLILNLLMETAGSVNSQQVIKICGLFDISENSTRVTLARLVAGNMLEMSRRGVYQLGPAARNLADDLSHWREMENKVCSWDGRWIGVFISHLGRGDRTALRQRTRILQLAGFAELEQGLLIRPNNLVGGVTGLRKRLYHLGLKPDSKIMTLSDCDGDTQTKALLLWDGDDLNQHYREASRVMEDWLLRVDTLDVQTAARECFLIGEDSLRCIAYDPLLPEEMVDVAARRHYLNTMIRYERIGKSIWQQLYLNYREVV